MVGRNCEFLCMGPQGSGSVGLGKAQFGLMRDFCSLSAMSLPLGQIKMIVVLYGLS